MSTPIFSKIRVHYSDNEQVTYERIIESEIDYENGYMRIVYDEDNLKSFLIINMQKVFCILCLYGDVKNNAN